MFYFLLYITFPLRLYIYHSSLPETDQMNDTETTELKSLPSEQVAAPDLADVLREAVTEGRVIPRKRTNFHDE